MPPLIFALYCILCVVTGLAGRHRRSGFIGTVLLSFVLTPVLMLVLLYLTAPREVRQK
jgi:hypothetical protein